MVKITKAVKSFLRMFDLFPVTQFIRYKGEAQYTSATGGFCSVTILTIFAILFTNLAIKTVNRQIITWTSEVTNQMQPTSTVVSVSPAPFLFTVGIMGLNLNDPTKRWFDFTLTERKYRAGGIQISNKSIQLEPCTEQHFSITDQLKSNFHKVPAYKWLCPPLGYSFEVSGKFTSQFMNYLDLSVYKCNPSLNASRPCATSTQIQNMQAAMGQFLLSQFYINPLLNPGSQNYIDYYLQDRNYIAFTSKLGTYSNIHIQDYTIVTDESILPFAVAKSESGVIIPQLFQNINFEVTSDNLAAMYFYKSSSSTTYNRQFYKIDSFFSYVGGLVGVIMGVMMLLSSYNQLAFQISLARDLFHDKDDKRNEFSLLHFIQYSFYSVIKAIYKQYQKIENLEKYETIKQEMSKQLDISVILSRIQFLERSIQTLFENGQFQAMHLAKKLSIEQAKIQRHYYNILDAFEKRKNQTNNTAYSLNTSSNQLKFAPQHLKEFEKQESQDSDESQLQEELVVSIKNSIKQFKASLEEGDRISKRIDSEIHWEQLQVKQGTIHEQFSFEDIKSNANQKSIIEPNPQELNQLRVIVKPSEGKVGHFEFVNYAQFQDL